MKKYVTLAKKIKAMILSGELKKGDRIPSVRNTAKLYSCSLTTVKNAYFELCAEGYIIAKEKSGYYVANDLRPKISEQARENKSNILYDLSGGCADIESFDFALWQRYVKNALSQKSRLLSYSEPMGEYDLRQAIAEYIRKKRNVITSPEKIVVAAGIFPLLTVLSTLLKDKKTVSFNDDNFLLGRSVFEREGYLVKTKDKDADIIYVSPSYMTHFGNVMSIKRRVELSDYSAQKGSLIIEDDYESEFLYTIKPIPSLYTLGFGNVIYIGSFSAMLLPSIRISFMVLNDELYSRYKNAENTFAQTASKTEQIALCGFIRDGRIYSRLNKVRRDYSAKTKAFLSLLKKEIKNADIKIGENTLQVLIRCDFKGEITDFAKSGIKVFAEKKESNRLLLAASPSAIPYSELSAAAKALAKVIVD